MPSMLQEKINELDKTPCLAGALAEKFLTDKQTFEKYKHLTDSCFVPMCLSNRNGGLIYCNKSYLEMVGADSIDQVLGFGWQSVVSDGDRERVSAGFQKYLKKQELKFWGLVEYQNLKTKEKFQKKVIVSRILDNGYGISVAPLNFEVPADFIEGVFP